MEDKFCGTCGSNIENGKCPNCDVIEPKELNVKEKNKESSFVWGILGFFFPIVGLILLLVWLKKNKSNAKAAGIGALIGGIVGIILITLSCLWYNDFFDPYEGSKDVTIKKAVEKNNNFSISDYEYVLDFHDEYIASKSISKYNAVNEKGKQLFSIHKISTKVKDGLQVDYKIVMNNNKEISFDEYYSGIDPYEEYHFYYKDNIIIFNVKNNNKGYYFYDLDNDKLYAAFVETDDDSDLSVSNITINENNYISFEAKLNASYYSSKKSIYDKVISGKYNTIYDLDNELYLLQENDFTVKKVIIYKEGVNKYLKSKEDIYSIKDLYNEQYAKLNTLVVRTKECTGRYLKNSNVHELSLIEVPDKECKTITYEINDDFTIVYELSGDYGYTKYVNGKEVDTGLYPDFGIGWSTYVSGKTLVMHEWTTDLGADVYLINTNGERYNIKDGKNLLDYDGMTEEEYKVDSDGNLVILGIRHSNQCGTVINNSTCLDQKAMCSISYNDLVTKYNLSSNFDFKTEYIYKINKDGIYDMNYSSKKVIQSLEDYYNSSCKQTN